MWIRTFHFVKHTHFKKGALYLGEVFIKLWVEKSHVWLHILVQNQGEHRKHGVDGGIPAQNNAVYREMRDGQQNYKLTLSNISTHLVPCC